MVIPVKDHAYHNPKPNLYLAFPPSLRIGNSYLPSNIFLMWAVEYDLGRSRGIWNVSSRPIAVSGEAAYTKGTVPDELRDDTERTRHTKEDSVVVLLVKTVAAVLASSSSCLHLFLLPPSRGNSLLGEEDTRVGVHIRPGVYLVSLLSFSHPLK